MALAAKIKSRQIIAVTLFAFAIFTVVFSLMFKASPAPATFTDKLTHFHTNSQPVKVIEHWQETVENEQNYTKQELDKVLKTFAAQQELLDKQQEVITRLESTVLAVKTAQQHNNVTADNKFSCGADDVDCSLSLNGDGKDDGLMFLDQPKNTGKVAHKSADVFPVANQSVPMLYESQNTPPVPPKINKLTHVKIERKDSDVTQDAQSYIPAGSFVRGVVLGGMMAGAGIQSQSEPRPVLLRLIDHSQLPNRVKRQVKDCHILASGYGDVSSERAYIRAESMSCVMRDNRVFEKPIQAYLAGSDSMSGIQGDVIRNEKAMISNAFFSGLVNGSANAFQSTLGQTSVSALGSVYTQDKKDIVPGMMANGLSNSANELERYFIDLAKQHHPVIVITPGQEVTVVFLKGLSFKGAVK